MIDGIPAFALGTAYRLDPQFSHEVCMFPVFTLIFLIVPIVEVYLLIQVGQVIGALWTVFLVVLTAVIGIRLLRIQGLSTLMRAQQKMQAGQAPASEMLEGVGLVLAGAFLLTPGFFTDAVGFLLLFPPSRIWLVKKFISNMAISGRFTSQSGQA
ncbi:MAG: FxsA family protein, partial [Gammaproteobacteria bacterium]